MNLVSSNDIQRLENSIKNLERKIDNTLSDVSKLHSKIDSLERIVQKEDHQTDRLQNLIDQMKLEILHVETRLKQHIETHSFKGKI